MKPSETTALMASLTAMLLLGCGDMPPSPSTPLRPSSDGGVQTPMSDPSPASPRRTRVTCGRSAAFWVATPGATASAPGGPPRTLDSQTPRFSARFTVGGAAEPNCPEDSQ